MRSVQGPNCLIAWKNASQQILGNRGELLHLVIEIERPTEFEEDWFLQFSPRRVHPAADDIRDVADTIFPFALQQRFPDRSQFYAEYLRRHARAMRFRRNAGTWGTYFERLIKFGAANSKNQLETAIGKLQTWPRSTTGLVFHLSSASLDNPRTRGGPCWHYGQLIWQPDGTLDLAVVYRNHDYFNKALGNFIGLGRLLSFISQESGKRPGKLICHSMRGYVDVQARLRALGRL